MGFNAKIKTQDGKVYVLSRNGDKTFIYNGPLFIGEVIRFLGREGQPAEIKVGKKLHVSYHPVKLISGDVAKGVTTLKTSPIVEISLY